MSEGSDSERAPRSEAKGVKKDDLATYIELQKKLDEDAVSAIKRLRGFYKQGEQNLAATGQEKPPREGLFYEVTQPDGTVTDFEVFLNRVGEGTDDQDLGLIQVKAPSSIPDDLTVAGLAALDITIAYSQQDKAGNVVKKSGYGYSNRARRNSYQDPGAPNPIEELNRKLDLLGSPGAKLLPPTQVAPPVAPPSAP